MDEREIEWKIYLLEEERNEILSSLEQVEEDLKKKNKKKLEELRNDLLDDLKDIDCDIAMYQEMLDKLYYEEEVQRFDLHDEILTGGDY